MGAHAEIDPLSLLTEGLEEEEEEEDEEEEMVNGFVTKSRQRIGFLPRRREIRWRMGTSAGSLDSSMVARPQRDRTLLLHY